MKDLRSIAFKIQGKEHKGYFHCYAQEGNLQDGIGLYALVEYENGEVNYVEAHNIKFTDRELKETRTTPPLIEYEHYKGARYSMIATATHTETGEELAIYSDIEDEVWARPLGMFHGTLVLNGERINRFERIWKVDTEGYTLISKKAEDIKAYSEVQYNNQFLYVTDIYATENEGVCFICTNEKGKEFKLSAEWGENLDVVQRD